MSKSTQWQRVNPIEQLMLDQTNHLKPDIITIIITISANLTPHHLHKIIIPRLLTHPRFTSIPRHNRHTYRFESVPNFTSESPNLLAHHLFSQSPIPSTHSEQHQLALFNSSLQQIISTPLHRNRPLWQLYVFPNWSLNPNTRHNATTLVLRVHHSVSDGIGLVKYFLARVVDNTESAKLLLPSARTKQQTSKNLYSTVFDALSDLKKVLLLPFRNDATTSLTRSQMQSLNKCALMSPFAISLEHIKKAAKKRNATINDLFITALSGAVRTYLIHMRDDLSSVHRFHVAVPFNRHVFDHFRQDDVSNQLTILAVNLNIHVEEREQRFEACKEEMTKLKQGYQPALALLAMKLISFLPKFLRTNIWTRASQAASILLSNVAGPVSVVTVGGFDVESIYFFPPCDSNSSVNMAIFSYNNGLFVGTSGDANRFKHPRKLINYFEKELKALL